MKEENDTMRVRDEEEFQKKKAALMEKCFDCYAEKGLCVRGNPRAGGGLRLQLRGALYLFLRIWTT